MNDDDNYDDFEGEMKDQMMMMTGMILMITSTMTIKMTAPT